MTNAADAHDCGVRRNRRIGGAAVDRRGTQQSTTTFKNIKVFDGLSDQQIDDAMMYMRASLGVQCEHCHDDKDWSLDTKEEKRYCPRDDPDGARPQSAAR